MKKLTTALCAVLLMILVLMPGAAAAGPALSATRAYCIIDADTGLVLAQQNMNEELHPASITKVMTLALACEKAQGSWDGVKLTVSHEDVYSLAGTDSSHIALQEGEEVPLTDALYATQMASANDGANLLAEYFGGGTIADGVTKMNAQVRELGLAHTHFANPHGISDEDHYTSCYDMAQILRWALQQPGFETVFTRNEMYTMQPTNLQPVTRYFSQQDKMRIGQIKCAGGELYVAASFCDKMGGTEKNDWYILKGGKLEKILDNDYTIGCNITTDCRYGRSSSMAEYQGKLLYLSTVEKTCFPKLLGPDGVMEVLFPFDGAVDGVAVCGDTVLFTAMKKGKLQELWCWKDGKIRQLTRLNTHALSGKYVGEPEYCGFVNSQGTRIDGWIIKPFGYDENKSYPALLSMHGGPCVAWGELFVHEMQMLAGQGYFVFFCNPRGSDGRGAKFADIKNKYGTVDFEDFMEFTDHVLECCPQIDKNRLGVLGGSYGGYMTNWIIGNTTRFAAAVSQRSFCNPISDFGNSCIGYTFDAKEFAATPWNGLDRMWDHAPLKYAPYVKTPTLFIHSLEDYNCPLSQGFEMFAALKYPGVTSEMVLFKGENHELSRSGKPLHRQRRLKEILRWFETYLKK